ncbi:MAG: hypothetical protein R2752_03380 [Vicinamibacterales bacterium]
MRADAAALVHDAIAQRDVPGPEVVERLGHGGRRGDDRSRARRR